MFNLGSLQNWGKMGIVARVATRLERQSHLMMRDDGTAARQSGIGRIGTARTEFGASGEILPFLSRSDACGAWLSDCEDQPEAGTEFRGNRRFFGAHS